MFRRKAIPQRLHPAHDAFTAQAERVQAARKALLSCLPVGRVEPAPVSVGLDVLRDEVTAVAEAMEDWRVGEVDEQWRRCRVAIDEALEAVPRARKLAEATAELEELLGAVSDVVEPLGNAWRAAEQRWRALRERV